MAVPVTHYDAGGEYALTEEYIPMNVNSPYDNPRAGRSDSRGSGRGRSSRPQDPFSLLADQAPGLLAQLLTQFAPSDGPGLSVFDFNPNGFTPVSELIHDGDDLLIRLELAGVKSEDVSVELADNRLIVTGEKKEEARTDGHKKLHEIRYGKFKRVYPVPAKVSADSVQAAYKDGVLTLRVVGALRKSEGIKINVE